MSERAFSVLGAIAIVLLFSSTWFAVSPPTDKLAGKPNKRMALGIATIAFMLGMAFLNDLRN